MKNLQVFDPALCCSSGVCGTEVDQKLVTFSADVDWAKQHGAVIEEYHRRARAAGLPPLDITLILKGH